MRLMVCIERDMSVNNGQNYTNKCKATKEYGNVCAKKNYSQLKLSRKYETGAKFFFLSCIYNGNLVESFQRTAVHCVCILY